HALNQAWRNVDAVIRKRREGRGMLEQRQVRSSEREGKVGDQTRRDPELAAKLNHLIDAQPRDQADGRHVSGLGQRVQQRDSSLELVVVVVRRPGTRGGRETYGS